MYGKLLFNAGAGRTERPLRGQSSTWALDACLCLSRHLLSDAGNTDPDPDHGDNLQRVLGELKFRSIQTNIPSLTLFLHLANKGCLSSKSDI